MEKKASRLPATVVRDTRTGRIQTVAGEDGGVGEEAPRKKNFRLRQSKIDRAMEILGTRTETETIEQALDMIVLRNNLVRGVRSMSGANLSSPFESQ